MGGSQIPVDKLCGKHPATVCANLITPRVAPILVVISQSGAGQLAIARHVAPICLSNDWRVGCHARSLSASYGDGQGAMIWAGCDNDSDDALGIQTDPEQPFAMIAAPGPNLTDLLVSVTITTFMWLVVQNYYAMTPDFVQAPLRRIWQGRVRRGTRGAGTIRS